MASHFLFADEAGCFEFARKPNVSRYFILATVSLKDCGVGDALVALRRKLVFEGQPLGDYFHASTDKQAVRDEVFKVLCKHDFKVQATIMEKSKAQPQVTVSRARFYKYGWFYHMRYGASKTIPTDAKLMVVAAALGIKKERASFERAVSDVMRQILPKVEHKSNFCPAAADPCLQVADYCAWAIQRKWESPDQRDVRSFNLIKDRIGYEYDLWARGTKHHY